MGESEGGLTFSSGTHAMSQLAATLMERKIKAGRPRPDPSIMSPERALQMAFARASEKQMNLPARMPAFAELRLSGPELAEVLPEHALLALLDGPQDGVGLLAIAPAALSSLIEIMTLGRVAERAPPVRRPTRTDAAMVSSFVDLMLGECETLLAHDADLIWFGGFRYNAHLPDPRPLGMMLEAPAYRVFRMTLAFGDPANTRTEERSGEILLALPALGRGTMPLPRAEDQAAPPSPQSVDPSTAAAGWEMALERVVLPASSEVIAVLSRVTLTLAELMQLEVGVSLTLPGDALRTVQIEGRDGRAVSMGQLGQGNGCRVVRLTGPDADRSVAPPIVASELVAARDQPLNRSARPGQRPTEADLSAPIELPRNAGDADPAQERSNVTEEALAKAG